VCVCVCFLKEYIDFSTCSRRVDVRKVRWEGGDTADAPRVLEHASLWVLWRGLENCSPSLPPHPATCTCDGT